MTEAVETVAAPSPETSTLIEPTGQAQDAPQPETRGPLNKQEAKRSFFAERRAQEAAQVATEMPAEEAQASVAPVVDTLGRPHDPATGKFLPTATPANAPVAEAPVEASASSDPEGFVRIELPEDHPLRARGREYILAPADLERDYRSLANSPVKLKGVETELTQMREQVLRLQAEQETRQKLYAGPEYAAARAKIDAVRSVDPEAAALMEDGLERKVAAATDGRFSELQNQQWGQQVKTAGDQTEAAAWETATRRYPMEWLQSPNGQKVWRDATAMYVTEMQQMLRPGEAPQLNPARIVEIADVYALRDPALREILTGRISAERAQQEQAERQRIAAETEAAAKQREAENLQRTAQKQQSMHPLGRVSSAVRTDRIGIDPNPVEDYSNLSGPDLKRTLRQQARQTANTLFNR